MAMEIPDQIDIPEQPPEITRPATPVIAPVMNHDQRVPVWVSFDVTFQVQ
jgi:hypothetical protein